MQTAAIGWVKTTAAGIGYCSHGQHFTKDGDTVWRFFVSQTTSREAICDECAEAELDRAAAIQEGGRR